MQNKISTMQYKTLWGKRIINKDNKITTGVNKITIDIDC